MSVLFPLWYSAFNLWAQIKVTEWVFFYLFCGLIWFVANVSHLEGWPNATHHLENDHLIIPSALLVAAAGLLAQNSDRLYHSKYSKSQSEPLVAQIGLNEPKGISLSQNIAGHLECAIGTRRLNRNISSCFHQLKLQTHSHIYTGQRFSHCGFVLYSG